MNYIEKIRVIDDFPKPGISFKDITTLLKDGEAYSTMLDEIVEFCWSMDATLVVGPEARGFLLGAPLAYGLRVGFAPVRKPGKLPGQTTKAEYALEYGTDSLEIHEDAIGPNDKVLIIDDVLATGGTAHAKAELAESTGATVVGYAFLLELDFLHGREKLADHKRICTLIHVASE
jgi:adenine phosphoribosyltransferase